jgi:hypothetical protein
LSLQDHDAFARLEREFRTNGPEATFDLLIRRAREEKDYRVLFGALRMQARHRLGLPPIETEPDDQLAGKERIAYQAALEQAARETGELALANGDIAGAWPYYKALGETAPIAAALENASGGDNPDRLIEIAFQEGVNVRRGFALILEHRGICSALTWLPAVRDLGVRQHCLRLLVRSLYRELAASLKETIAAAEGGPPGTDRVAELIAGRDWLFEGTSYYVDSTHLTALLRFIPEAEDAETLRMAAEMADYGQHLNPMYHFRGDPPFEDPYADLSVYLHALLGENVETAIEHFRRNVAPGNTAAEVLVDLLVKLGRFGEAIDVALEFLRDSPSVLRVCQMAGDFATLLRLAREREDPLGFVAGLIQL